MERIILIKYGEMTTKKGNRNFFVKTLASNLEQKLKDYPCTLEKDMARMYLSYDEREEIFSRILKYGTNAEIVAPKREKNLFQKKVNELIEHYNSM